MTIDTEYKQVENLHDIWAFFVNFYFGDKDVAYKVIQHNTHLTCVDKTQAVETPDFNENSFI